ncbi:hypothetical protein HELRODRAFT_78557, partial [Helobdella robusta]|uniref:C3H1-type domain-containing protein n=1 Tax=Helobdella robusta TaxID=6412 RepID=T1G3C9_HELRO
LRAKMSVYPRLEVCRDYIDNKCNRDENSCRFAHPPENIRISNGMVICCADSLQVFLQQPKHFV